MEKFIICKLVLLILFLNFIPIKLFSVTPGEIAAEQIRLMAEDARATATNTLNSATSEVDAAIQNAIISAGMPNSQISQARTPDEEIKRRREIINSAFKQYNASMTAYNKGVLETERSTGASDRDVGALSGKPREGAVASERTSGSESSEDVVDALSEDGKPLETGSARSKPSHEAETSSPRNDKEFTLPPRAIEVKGKVLISGGDATMSKNRKIEEVDYKIEEALVGNILVSETKDKKTGKTTESEYMIDTISKNIDVKSLSGGRCMNADSASATFCSISSPYVRSTVEKDNKYPNFGSNVIYLEDNGDKVELSVDVPKIRFSTLMNEASATVDCGDTTFEMSKGEFELMLNSGKIVLKKQMKKSSGCKDGSSIEISLVVSRNK